MHILEESNSMTNAKCREVASFSPQQLKTPSKHSSQFLGSHLESSIHHNNSSFKEDNRQLSRHSNPCHLRHQSQAMQQRTF